MVVMDELPRRCLAIHTARRIRAREELEIFAELMVRHGVPNLHALRQCAGDGCRGTTHLAAANGQQDGVHHTAQPLGERLLRVDQQQPA